MLLLSFVFTFFLATSADRMGFLKVSVKPDCGQIDPVINRIVITDSNDSSDKVLTPQLAFRYKEKFGRWDCKFYTHQPNENLS